MIQYHYSKVASEVALHLKKTIGRLRCQRWPSYCELGAIAFGTLRGRLCGECRDVLQKGRFGLGLGPLSR